MKYFSRAFLIRTTRLHNRQVLIFTQGYPYPLTRVWLPLKMDDTLSKLRRRYLLFQIINIVSDTTVALEKKTWRKSKYLVWKIKKVFKKDQRICPNNELGFCGLILVHFRSVVLVIPGIRLTFGPHPGQLSVNFRSTPGNAYTFTWLQVYLNALWIIIYDL